MLCCRKPRASIGSGGSCLLVHYLMAITSAGLVIGVGAFCFSGPRYRHCCVSDRAITAPFVEWLSHRATAILVDGFVRTSSTKNSTAGGKRARRVRKTRIPLLMRYVTYRLHEAPSPLPCGYSCTRSSQRHSIVNRRSPPPPPPPPCEKGTYSVSSSFRLPISSSACINLLGT